MSETNKAEPLISVVLPFYNAEKYLKDSIQSILSQTYTHFELLLLNDGSTDKSVEIINQFNDSRIKLHDRKENRRLIYTLNEGLNLCNGDFVARMDADDIADSTRFEKQVNFLLDNPDYVAVGSNYLLFGAKKGESNLRLSDEMIKLSLFFENPMAHPTVMFRNDVIQKDKIRYRKELLHIEDWGFWYDLSKKGKLANLKEPLLNYRMEGQNISEQNLTTLEERSNLFYNYVLTDLYKDHYSFELNRVHWVIQNTFLRKDEVSSILDKIKKVRIALEKYGFNHKSLDQYFKFKYDRLFYKIADLDKRHAFQFLIKTKQLNLAKLYYLIRAKTNRD
ncbi:glycosyltransferase [Paracrocinitomix mangrovi]|uniref:glycosyltransferase family 2 protein n=1 Tax=Paracrocinitomix mangrovi TaxID=2862509 RepID=UPI001C8E053C|nr:glycosyltransferase [Paracrocinitomix mangrovi]UKN01563.1 glycosyltransferase [Paracrocinitomix mangrovi]